MRVGLDSLDAPIVDNVESAYLRDGPMCFDVQKTAHCFTYCFFFFLTTYWFRVTRTAVFVVEHTRLCTSAFMCFPSL